MSRITNIFNNLKKQQKKAFIPFVTAGDGGLELSLEIMQTYVKNGADIIEIGMPFSDTMADGPIITRSHQRAIKNNISVNDIFTLVEEFRAINDSVAIVLMGYLNPIEIYGYLQFANKCKKSGVDGVLIVDNPPEEAMELKVLLDKNNIDFIFLVAPTTTNSRLEFLSKVVSGFVYFVSLKGVTGSSNIDPIEVNKNLTNIKKYINLPICVGFGVKDAKTAKEVSKNSDGVVVATSLINFIEKYNDNKDKIITNIDKLSQQIAGVLK